MNKTIKTKRISLVLTTIFTFALGLAVMPVSASAQYYISYPGVSNNSNQYNTIYQTPAPAPVYYENIIAAPAATPTPTVYSNSSNPNQTKSTGVVAKAKTTPSIKSTDITNSLAASVVSADNGFMPANLIQWLFFAILILLIVALVRKIYGGAEKYHALPMKHN